MTKGKLGAWFSLFIVTAGFLAETYLGSRMRGGGLFERWPRGHPTSFPGSLFSVSLGRWKKDPGCGWSCDHPESWWQKNLLGGRGGRVFCLLLWQTLWVLNPLVVAKNYSLYRGSKSNLPMKNATRFLPSSKYRRLSFTKKFGSQMEQKLFDG